MIQRTEGDKALPWEALLQRLQALSAEMLRLAKSGEWDAVAQREAQRRRLLEGLFDQPPAATREYAVRCMRDVLDTNNALCALGKKQRDELAGQLWELAKARAVRKTYTAVDKNDI